jgi:hypothetical protein
MTETTKTSEADLNDLITHISCEWGDDHDMCIALRELKALRHKDDWISVETRLPGHSNEVFVAITTPSGARLVERAEWSGVNPEWKSYSEGCRWYYSDHGWVVTHWMEDRPLPTPPAPRTEGK